MEAITMILYFGVIFAAVFIAPKYIKAYFNNCVTKAYESQHGMEFLARNKIGDIRRKK